MLRRGFRFAVLLSVGLGLGAPQAARADFARLILHSQPGDYIGQGGDYDITYTPETSIFFFAQINLTLPDGTPTFVRFGFLQPGSPDNFATLDFSTDRLGIPIQPGTYTDAQRASFAGAGHPGLDVTFQHRGSNTLTGSFTIQHVEFDTPGPGATRIVSFGATFEQHSEGFAPALFGEFDFNFSPQSVVPEPSSLTLLGLGAVGLLGYGWRHKRAKSGKGNS